MLTAAQFPARSIEFTVRGEPATKARARVTLRRGKVHAYTPEATKAAEAAMAAEFLGVVKRLAPSTIHAFGVEATFYMASGIRRDVDNMLKVVLDGLNKVAWGDDYQVVEVIGRKRAVTADDARTEVRIYTLGVLIEREARCEHCEATFPRPPSHAAKKYCSDNCRSLARLARIAKTCGQCGETFHATKKAQAHCSRACSDASKNVDVVCVECQKTFSKARSLLRSGNNYCSDECKATYWRTHRKSAAKGTCDDCGGPTTKTSYKRCRDCSYAAGGRHAYTEEPA